MAARRVCRRQYIPIFIFALLAAGFPAVTLVLFKFIRPDSVTTGVKVKPYECGMPAESDSRGRYSVRFYIVAILFVIFDVETIFLFPWAVLYSTHVPGFRLSPALWAGQHVRISGNFDRGIRSGFTARARSSGSSERGRCGFKRLYLRARQATRSFRLDALRFGPRLVQVAAASGAAIVVVCADRDLDPDFRDHAQLPLAHAVRGHPLSAVDALEDHAEIKRR
jgi:NADH:ubiquinone oxidoreductase subunit 3 (subunit A)